jgi:hypothetical protein
MKRKFNPRYFYLYNPHSMKRSSDQLQDTANSSVRRAHSDMTNLLAKLHILIEAGEPRRAEYRKVEGYAKRLESIIGDFKANLMR